MRRQMGNGRRMELISSDSAELLLKVIDEDS